MSSSLEQRAAISGLSEIRSYPAQFEVRGMSGAAVELAGYASTTETPYEMFDSFGQYNEVIRAGAFRRTLAEGADVAYLANHGGLTMARTKPDAAGVRTLVLQEDSSGLHTLATLNTSRSDVRDLITAVEDGNIDEMSFGFRVRAQQWSPDFDQRDIMDVNLNRGDVSAVNYGANPTTNIGLQRAFRSARPAALHRMAEEIRAGKALSASTMSTLSQVLDLIASADKNIDAAQPLLADFIGVPNPDEAESLSADAAGERAIAYLDTLRLKEQHDRERRTA